MPPVPGSDPLWCSATFHFLPWGSLDIVQCIAYSNFSYQERRTGPVGVPLGAGERSARAGTSTTALVPDKVVAPAPTPTAPLCRLSLLLSPKRRKKNKKTGVPHQSCCPSWQTEQEGRADTGVVNSFVPLSAPRGEREGGGRSGCYTILRISRRILPMGKEGRVCGVWPSQKLDCSPWY